MTETIPYLNSLRSLASDRYKKICLLGYLKNCVLCVLLLKSFTIPPFAIHVNAYVVNIHCQNVLFTVFLAFYGKCSHHETAAVLSE